MAVKVGVAYVDIKPDITQFGRQLKAEVSRDIQAAGRQGGKELGDSLRSSVKGALAGVGGVAAGLGIKNLLSDAIRAASDLNEEASKSQTVFGAAAPVISAWAKNATDSIGLSERAALAAAGTFGNMFSQIGIGSDQVATMSESIVGLATDFASFHNADISDVIDAETAAFRGEYDALQRYVPLINAATVEQRALADTGKRNAAQLTAQERATATYEIIVEGAGDAVGDFARTHDSLANAMRRTQAETENTQASIGQQMIPAMQQWNRILREEVLPAFAGLFSTQGEAPAWAAAIQDTVGDLVGWLVGILQQTMRLMANFFDRLPTHIGEGVAKDLRNAADAGDGFRDKMHASREELSAAGAAADAAKPKVAGFGDTTKAALTGIPDAAKQMADSVKSSIASMLSPLQRFHQDAVAALTFDDVHQKLTTDREWEGDYRKLGAAAKAGIDEADKSAKNHILTLGELRQNLKGNLADTKAWQADLKRLHDRGFGDLAANLAQLGPEAALAVHQAALSPDALLRDMQSDFAERGKLMSDETVKSFTDGLTAPMVEAGGKAGDQFASGFDENAPRTALAIKQALHDELVNGPAVLSPLEATSLLGIPYNPGGVPQLPAGVAPMTSPTVSFPSAGGMLGGGTPVVTMPSAAPTVSTTVHVQTNADPNQIASAVGDHLAWRLGPMRAAL